MTTELTQKYAKIRTFLNFSQDSKTQKTLENIEQINIFKGFIAGGEGEIRTLEPLLTVTRFPVVRPRPTRRLLQIFECRFGICPRRLIYHITNQWICQYLFLLFFFFFIKQKYRSGHGAIAGVFSFDTHRNRAAFFGFSLNLLGRQLKLLDLPCGLYVIYLTSHRGN